LATEIEIKLHILESNETDILRQLERILGVSGFKCHDLRNLYFDTPDFQLNAERIALRIRHKSGCYIQTLKTKGCSVAGLHQRGEWEWALESPELNIRHLNESAAWPSSIDPRQLMPVFETNFTRHQIEIEWQGSDKQRATIELAVDLGVVTAKKNNADNQSEAINEIELELLSGKPDTLIELGQYLLGRLPVTLDDVSKAERGYRLLNAGA